MAIAARLLREPLVHFIVAGAVLFGAWTAFRGDEFAADATGTIVVDRRELLTFLQYRANAFEPEAFGAALDAMSDAELAEIIDAYVDEEILYREARGLGLEASDNVIRQRMVQKMSFLLADIAAAGGGPERAELEAYFDANIEAYAVQPWATFTHVFFDSTRHGEAGARAAAEDARRRLNQSAAGFNDAGEVGDRFPFLRNYVERTFEYIASHFGYDFAASLEALAAVPGEWQGPIRSVYGEHVVLLTHREPRMLPTLDAVFSDVERDYATEQANAARAEMLEAVRERYRIEIGAIRSDTVPSDLP
jgi:hypothetical protein